MNIKKVPNVELQRRMSRFLSAMTGAYPDWEVCAIVGQMSMYFLTGTIADGLLFIQRDKEAVLWVRRNYERAILESEFKNIKPMASFKDIASYAGKLPETIYIDKSAVTLELYGFLTRHLLFKNSLPVDRIMLGVRSVKSQYEIDIMKNAGSVFDRLLRENLPGLLKEGMSEADLGADLFSLFIKNGYHGVSRFSMQNADVVLGHIGFGESSLYPSVFNGASGLVGLCPASPVLGSRDVKLKSGDLIYIDIGFGMDGYNIDKTLIYSFKNPQEDYVNDVHVHLLNLEKQAVSMMRAGEKPSVIYNAICELVRPDLRDRFMGTAGRTVPFLGHGVGLYINELPVIANGFDDPLECGMTIAIEPKVGLAGVGMVGSENTYLITESGSVSLSGETQKIILCE